MKLKEDFGVMALLCVLVLVGSFFVLIVGLSCGYFDDSDVLIVITSWVSSVLAAYGIVKGIKSGKP